MAKKAKFRIGDRVKYMWGRSNSEYMGYEGIVEEHGARQSVMVKFDSPPLPPYISNPVRLCSGKLEKIEPNFKIGDRVRYKDTGLTPAYRGRTGYVVSELRPGIIMDIKLKDMIDVRFDDTDICIPCFPENMEKIKDPDHEQAVKFKVGDRVKCTPAPDQKVFGRSGTGIIAEIGDPKKARFFILVAMVWGEYAYFSRSELEKIEDPEYKDVQGTFRFSLGDKESQELRHNGVAFSLSISDHIKFWEGTTLDSLKINYHFNLTEKEESK